MDLIANKSIGEVRRDFILSSHLNSQQKNFNEWIRGSNYKGIIVNKNHPIKAITYDEIYNKSRSTSNSIKVLERMGNLGARFIANRVSNAFEIKFNDVDVDKSVNHTVKEVDY